LWEPDIDSNGQSANLNCQDGFSLNKAVQISCMSNNTWSNIDGVCLSGKYRILFYYIKGNHRSDRMTAGYRSI